MCEWKTNATFWEWENKGSIPNEIKWLVTRYLAPVGNYNWIYHSLLGYWVLQHILTSGSKCQTSRNSDVVLQILSDKDDDDKKIEVEKLLVNERVTSRHLFSLACVKWHSGSLAFSRLSWNDRNALWLSFAVQSEPMFVPVKFSDKSKNGYSPKQLNSPGRSHCLQGEFRKSEYGFQCQVHMM